MSSASKPVSSNAPADAHDEEIAGVSTHALKVMMDNGVAALPEHYAVFYAYAKGDDKELVKEIDDIIANKQPFANHTLNALHSRVTASGKASSGRSLADVTSDTNLLISEVMGIVGKFHIEAADYKANLGKTVHDIKPNLPPEALQQLAKDLISATTEMRERSEVLHHKLEESRHEVDTLKKSLETVTKEAEKDFLTGIYNRKTLFNMANDMMQATRSNSTELSLLMLDVDHFKQFNDKYGHPLGDEVLKIVAKALTQCVRGQDIVARYGGEEFCVVLAKTPLSGAKKVAENIRNTIATRDLQRKDTGESYGHITVSIGVSQMRGGDTLEHLIKRADEALYKAKHTGRNRVSAEGE